MNPLLDDLEDGDPDEPLTRWLERAPPFVTAARAASRNAACASDGFCVRVEGPGRSCPTSWTLPATEEERGRARFLLWSYGHALSLSASSEADALRAAESLRAMLPASRRVGLVLVADDLRALDEAPLAELRRLWRRRAVLQRLGRRHREDTARDDNALADDSEGAAPVIHLDPRQVLVLPRLEAIGREAELESEVSAVAPWLARASAE